LASSSTTHDDGGQNGGDGGGQWKTYGDLENYTPGKYQIKTFNKISSKGLARFPEEDYDIRSEDDEAVNAQAILLRSHKLEESEVGSTVRAIARWVQYSAAIRWFFMA